MRTDDLERLAAETRRIAALEDDDVLLAPRIAVRLLGAGAIRIVPALRSEACLAVIDGKYRIVLREVGRDTNFSIAHELGHWALREVARFRGGAEDEERAANYVGAAILAPPKAVTQAHRFYGEKPRELAAAFGLSQTSTVLRLAEVRHDERAIVTKNKNVILRTAGGFEWESVDIRAGDPVDGLAKTRLRGGIDEGRVAWRLRGS